MTESSPYKYLPVGATFEDYQRSREAKADMIVRVLEHHMGELTGKSMLDLGCNDGYITRYLSAKFRESTGSDIDPEIVEIAKEKHAGTGISFLVNDSFSLPFTDARFDVVVANHVFYYCHEPVRMAEEIYRVLKPGGVCYLAITNGMFTKWYAKSPTRMREFLISITLRGAADVGVPRTGLEYREILRKFRIHDFTHDILKSPEKFQHEARGWQGLVLSFIHRLPSRLIKRVSMFSPTLIYLAEKDAASANPRTFGATL